MNASRRAFLKSTGATLVVGTGMPRAMDAAGFDPLEKNIRELQRAMARGQLTSARLVTFYLDRIAAYDQSGPRVNAVIAVNPHAAASARELDEERRRKGPRGPLHGVPILLKDNFDTNDMPTTGGCLALSGHQPKDDAFQVKLLRDAGAVILGKVNLHELALGLTTVSSIGGQTLDPYDLTRAPGGSSGGSAVAATLNFAAGTLGTDTAGSIRIPSCHNNVVGLRPTIGLSSRAGIIPFSRTQDVGGPIARTVEDVALLLDATAGYDPHDPVTATGRSRTPRTYTSSLERRALKGARIGVLTEYFGGAPEDAEVAAVVKRAIDDMRSHGATTVDVAIPDLAAMIAASNVFLQEIKASLGGYLKTSGAPVGSVEDLLASGLHVEQLQGILEIANRTPDDYFESDEHQRRLAARRTLGQAVVKVMDDSRVDALVYPVAKRIAPVIGGNQLGSNEALSPQTGFPAINVPAGFTPGGFPVGLELLGRPFAEPTLIAIAYSFEQATRHRKPPSVDARPVPVAAASGGAASFEVTLEGAVPFTAAARFTFDAQTSRLGYDIALPAASIQEIAGVYLHRRVNRLNGGVVHILAKSASARVNGAVTLSEPEAADLKTGKLYVAAVSARDPRLSARADLAFPD
jgi:Asp-tRNA(Asn)/Glu-tRNA(Gln) amidotransferase A subunit family amidase